MYESVFYQVTHKWGIVHFYFQLVIVAILFIKTIVKRKHEHMYVQDLRGFSRYVTVIVIVYFYFYRPLRSCRSVSVELCLKHRLFWLQVSIISNVNKHMLFHLSSPNFFLWINYLNIPYFQTHTSFGLTNSFNGNLEVRFFLLSDWS